MLWAKFAIPTVMATVGAGAMVAAAALPADTVAVDAGASAVWIDGPSGEAALAPGSVPVTAHATADDTITGLDLYVDGEKVTTDDTLERNGKLSYGDFTWDAEVGTHQLVVRQVGGDGDESAVRTIIILDGAPAATVTTTTSTTTPESTTTGPDDTTTTTSPTTIVTATPDPSVVTTSPPATDVPTPPTAPPTTQPAPSPTITSASIISAYQNRLYTQSCGYIIEVRATVNNADSARVTVDGTDFRQTMTRNGNNFSLVIGSGAMWGPEEVGTHDVIVEASRGGATARRTAGAVTIIQQCPKD